eukprot:TRINITY_DN313_c0_g1_i1.p1 TRINITY_DN313_c0_g1~~TRINITY_DN313_c0_g1_i1.p1  ORF type:complete len:391 (+),score=146.03 TRINITY_DN313_c0_g1_i1:196-1368(+)
MSENETSDEQSDFQSSDDQKYNSKRKKQSSTNQQKKDQNQNQIKSNQQSNLPKQIPQEKDSITNRPSDENDKTATNVNDYVRIQLKRDELEQILHEPYLEKLIKNYFVRIRVKNQVYICAKIKEIVDKGDSKRYIVGEKKTTKIIIAEYGSKKNEFKMDIISSKNFTQAEIDQFIKESNSEKIKLPTIKECIEMEQSKIEFKKKFTYSQKDYERLNAEKLRNGALTINYSFERINVFNELQIALESGQYKDDSTVIVNLRNKLQEIDKKITEQSINDAKKNQAKSQSTLNTQIKVFDNQLTLAKIKAILPLASESNKKALRKSLESEINLDIDLKLLETGVKPKLSLFSNVPIELQQSLHESKVQIIPNNASKISLKDYYSIREMNELAN